MVEGDYSVRVIFSGLQEVLVTCRDENCLSWLCCKLFTWADGATANFEKKKLLSVREMHNLPPRDTGYSKMISPLKKSKVITILKF